MSGCFGNSKEDQYFAAQLDRYLDSQDESYDIAEITISGDPDSMVDAEDQLQVFLNRYSDEYYLKIDWQSTDTVFKVESYTERSFEKLDDFVSELVFGFSGRVTFNWE